MEDISPTQALSTAKSFLGERVKFRIRKLIDAIYKLQHLETIECLVEVWFDEKRQKEVIRNVFHFYLISFITKSIRFSLFFW